VDILRSSEDVPPIPGGETVEEFQQRISDFMEDLAGKYMGKRILLISHGGVIQRMLRHTVGKLQNGNFRPACDNTSVSIFRKRFDGVWQMISWNDTSHLKNGMYSEKPLPL
jgi:probable phosphoglycerate mutase